MKYAMEFESKLTVSAGLNRCLDVTNALDSDAVLVVAVDLLVFELSNLVDQDTKLVCDVRNVVVAGLTPDGELLLWRLLAGRTMKAMVRWSNVQQPPCALFRRAPCCA